MLILLKLKLPQDLRAVTQGGERHNSQDRTENDAPGLAIGQSKTYYKSIIISSY